MNIQKLKKEFQNIFGEQETTCFSASGRTEICGNHTDHQRGKVLTAAVNLEILAVASKNNTNVIHIKSEGYPEFSVDLNSLEICEEEKGKSESLVRGLVKGFREKGIPVSGFDAVIDSEVSGGSGLSSSAAFEVLLATVMNYFFGEEKLNPVEIAKISQYAESVYFGKPCGLLDQMAVALGGCNYIDFKDPENLKIKSVEMEVSGYTLCVVNTGGDHSDLTQDYADITLDDREVSNFFGKNFLSEISEEEFYERMPELKGNISDRAILRGMHFFSEQNRVEEMATTLGKKDTAKFLMLVNESGNSSQNLLQNLYSASHPEKQAIPLALELTKRFLNGEGACRVHGGGFAGTIQCYVPENRFEEYKNYMENIFGKGSVQKLEIRKAGGQVIL